MRKVKPCAGSEPYIFLSYAHRNSEAALPIIARLAEAGYRVWYDEGIDPGTEWDENIAAHVEGCSFFLALISRAYLASDNCKDELNYARDLNKQRVLVYLEQVELPGGMRMRLSRIQAIHKYGYQDEQAFYAKLFSAQGIDVCHAPQAKQQPPVKTEAAPVQPRKPEPAASSVTPKGSTVTSMGLTPLPPLSLLQAPMPRPAADPERDTHNARVLEFFLETDGCPVKVENITHGPTMTRFELSLPSGMKLQKLMEQRGMITDLLGARDIRIEAPIPGTSLVGIEVPHWERTTVALREVLESSEMHAAISPLTVALGIDAAGKSVLCDLEKMPHLLMAGVTGAGKSVCIHSMLLSLLYRSLPRDVQFLLIDPKGIEFSSYNKLPHLLRPVAVDPPEALALLDVAMDEMMRRYSLFAEAQVRSIKDYNEKAAEKLPRIVVVIEELERLLVSHKTEVVERICRLTQLSRATGIHLIIATQHATQDVLTGLIRANIPSRIAFRVPTAEQSRLILNRTGAETLLGNGDMLYMPAGAFAPIRMQGCFVSEDEVRAVTDYLHAGGAGDMPVEPAPRAEVANLLSKMGNMVNEQRELLKQALDLTVEDGRVSSSLLQRRLRIGYNRAWGLVQEMERLGVIGPADGAKPRKCLITPAELAELRKQGKLP